MYKEFYGNIPNKDKIISYLDEGYKQNPGDWVLHLWIVGHTAKNMAKDLGLDPDIALACGCLHDIGKMTGAVGSRHFFEGYKLLRADSYFFPARIALTHSFPIRDVDSYLGDWNLPDEDKEFVADFLKYNPYNDYDLLIQLLDGLIKTKYLGVEARIEPKKEAYGDSEFFKKKIARLNELEDYFKPKLSKPIEKYMPRPRWYKFPYNLYRKN